MTATWFGEHCNGGEGVLSILQAQGKLPRERKSSAGGWKTVQVGRGCGRVALEEVLQERNAMRQFTIL